VCWPGRRGPPSHNPEAYKLYSNLAACYTKLGAYPEGIKAADRCIELEPSFVKGYSRKGTIQFFMKEYNKVRRVARVRGGGAQGGAQGGGQGGCRAE
jgi:tetratricopeptide (TPR) repeat protein